MAVFAQCAGRYSAEMEHAWLLGRPGRQAQDGRQQMVALIDAVAPHSGLSGPEILGLRIDSKMAHAALLTRATFGRDAQARRMAQRFVAGCHALLPVPRDLAGLR